MTAPNFFVVGAPKAGTTSLYHHLDQHPAVFMSPIKEPCFFAPEVVDLTPLARKIFDADRAALSTYLDGPIREKRDLGWVLEWDQYLKLFKNVRDETAVGEASVSYLGSGGAPRDIQARTPDARIVVMLRDPTDRLFSHYRAAHAAGVTTATFGQWMTTQTSTEAARQPAWGSVSAGRYAAQLRRYLDCFARDRVRVCLYDEYARAPETVLADVFAFLGVDPDHPIDTAPRHNATLVSRWPAMPRALRRIAGRAMRAAAPARIAERVRAWSLVPSSLGPTAGERAQAIEIYEEDIRALERLIDRDLSAWMEA